MTELVKTKEDEVMNYAKRIRQDKARWLAADVNKDDKLNYEEFVGFMHPEEKEHMFDVYTDEQMEEMDKDNDKLISIDEYIGELLEGWKKGRSEGAWHGGSQHEGCVTRRIIA